MSDRPIGKIVPGKNPSKVDVELTQELLESARWQGICLARLRALMGDETTCEFNVDSGSCWLFHGDTGHGFEDLEEAVEWLSVEDPWGGWRRPSEEEIAAEDARADAVRAARPGSSVHRISGQIEAAGPSDEGQEA